MRDYLAMGRVVNGRVMNGRVMNGRTADRRAARACAGVAAALFFALAAGGTARASESGAATSTSARPAAPESSSGRELGRSIALGLDIGGFSGASSIGVRLRLPIGESFALGVRGLMLANEATPYGIDGGPRADIGARIELVGFAYALAPGVRVYGGGGPQIFYSIAGKNDPKVNVGGGGEFGLEVFTSPRLSFFIEVGGSTGSDRKYGDGGSAVGGVHLYL